MPKISAATSKQLDAAIDRYNADKTEDEELVVNWGRERGRGTWWVHGAWGANLKTGLSFVDVVKYVNEQIETTVPTDPTN